MNWKNLLTGSSTVFQDLLIRQLELTHEMTALLRDYVLIHGSGEEAGIKEKASDLEHEADDIRQALVDRLVQTFVTPFDREDINHLSCAIDDICDYSENTIKEISVYEIKPDIYVTDMVDNLHKSVGKLLEASRLLGQDNRGCNVASMEAKSLENKIEGIYRKAIAHLSNELDIPYMIKIREVYRHLSNAADRVDAVANIMNSIVIKKSFA